MLRRRCIRNRKFFGTASVRFIAPNVYLIAVFFLPRMRGEQTDKEAFDKHIEALALKLDVYEKILSKQKYLAGGVCVYHNYVNMNIHLCTFLFC